MARGLRIGRYRFAAGAVAPLSIARRMQISRRILVILEGEGLANDATALIFHRFAVAAVCVNLFSFGKARDCSQPLSQAKFFGGSALAR
jgi:monovalent cation/hydrogen antiporter